LLEGVASLEDIDKALKPGLNHPLGPFELNNAVGLDIGLNVFRTLYDGYKDKKIRSSPNFKEEGVKRRPWQKNRQRLV